MKMAKNCGTNAFIFFAMLPKMDRLCSMNLRVSADLKSQIAQSGASGEQIYTIVIWKCRELLFTEDKVLAVPSPGNNGIEIVVPKNLVQEKIFLGLLEDLTLQIVNVSDVSENVFKRCLSYTIGAKLAPEWNKVGNYYVQGRNFLSCRKEISALSLEINVNKTQLYLVPTFFTIQLPRMKLDDLGICSNILTNFKGKKCDEIDRANLSESWCHVLPSLKKGMIETITHDIPTNSLFKTFDELKSYWKNSYGYRIPEPSDDTVYYNLRFFWMNNVVFTYPSYCILPFKPLIRKQTSVSAFEQHSQFSTAIRRRIPLICGVPWLKALAVKQELPCMQMTLGFKPASEQSYSSWTNSTSSDTPVVNVDHVFRPSAVSTIVCNSDTDQKWFQQLAASNETCDQQETSVKQPDDVFTMLQNFRRPEKLESAAKRIVPTFESCSMAGASTKSLLKKRPFTLQTLNSAMSTSGKWLSDDNIDTFCKKGQLNKVKVGQLADWAKTKGIHYHARMKKSDLINRIEKFVFANKAEP